MPLALYSLPSLAEFGWIALLSFAPALECRAAIPYAMLVAGMSWWQAWLLAVVVNWAVAPVIYLIMRYLVQLLCRWNWFDGFWQRYTARVLKRTEKAMRSWGALGLALFIGVPLPGSGVYSGGVAAYLLGMGFRRFLWVSLIGVLIACSLVTAIVVTGAEAFDWMLKDSD